MATTYVSTIKSSGGDYTSLAACEAGRQAAHSSGNISAATGDDSIEEWVCYSLDDTTRCNIDGWTTAAGNYIYIHADATGRHAGVWNGDKYNLVVSGDIAVGIYEDYVRLDGLQLANISPSADNKYVLYSSPAATADIRFSNLIIKGHGSATYNQRGIGTGYGPYYIWNTVIYNIPGHDSDCACIFNSTGTIYLYSCICIGGYYGIDGYNAVQNVKNTYCGGSLGEDFYRDSGCTLTKTNCASEDQSADDTGTGETATNCVAAAILIDTDTFVNVTPGSEDFHLAADGLSPLVGVGTDTSGEAAPLNFTTDIDGEARS